jgi:hypothetical protein
MKILLFGLSGAALMVLLPVIQGWGLGAYYPTSVIPSLPSPEQALSLSRGLQGPLAPLRQAHRQAAEQVWIAAPAGIDPKHVPVSE